MVAASGPVCAMDTRVGLMTMPVRSDLDCAFRLVTRAAPSQAVPSWKTTLGRSVMVQAVKSGLEVTDLARYGFQPPDWVTMVRGSNTVRAYMTPTSSKRACVGSKPCSSASVPKVSEPPRLGLPLPMPFSPEPLLLMAPARSPKSSALAAMMPATVAAPPSKSFRRSNVGPM